MAHLSRNLRNFGPRVRQMRQMQQCWLVKRAMGGGGGVGGDGLPIKVDIGKREVVGFGSTGEETYIDDIHFPFPAIRFKEDTAEISMLKEKEKGDWKKLSVEEKKQLYRASFCQTLTELEAPTGEWKALLGLSMMLISVGLWGYMWMKNFGERFYTFLIFKIDLEGNSIHYIICQILNCLK